MMRRSWKIYRLGKTSLQFGVGLAAAVAPPRNEMKIFDIFQNLQPSSNSNRDEPIMNTPKAEKSDSSKIAVANAEERSASSAGPSDQPPPPYHGLRKYA
jgi:hypothetical protein